MLEVIKRMIQTTIKNVGSDKIEITIKGSGNRILYPGDSITIDNGTRYKTKTVA